MRDISIVYSVGEMLSNTVDHFNECVKLSELSHDPEILREVEELFISLVSRRRCVKESDFILGFFKSGHGMQSRDYELFSSFLAGECYTTMACLSCEYYTPIQFYQGVLFSPWKTGLETYSGTFLSKPVLYIVFKY